MPIKQITNFDLNPPDQLELLEGKLRGKGVWATVWGKFDMRHLMLARHPLSHIAISRCGQIVATFDRIKEDSQVKKCLVCSLYDEAGEEVKLRNEKALSAIVETFVNQTQTKQENK